jgi:2-polyprenyl-3-methyl-5-hydroxy-6-metoxy-1,4-benzoquinol methylase
MTSEGVLHPKEPEQRSSAFGYGYQMTPMDRVGIWLSERFVRRRVGGFAGKQLLDIGAGHNALLVRQLLPQLAGATVIDLTLADDLKQHEKVRAIEGRLPESLEQLAADSFDAVVCINVLEHLFNPELVVAHARRMLRPGGVALFNVPSWSGKVVLETAAFRLGLTTPEEIDDHKCYYDTRQLWQLLVRGGFRPREIECGAHKFRLNTFGVCRRR